MEDFNYDEYGSGYDDSLVGAPGAGLMDKARRWVNISGAVCSVSLIIGVAVWGYELAVRDVNGVPVMRAAVGAMRVAPLDPGGEQALNQGLTVNAIAAMGTSAGPADTITLAPQAETLAPEDVPQASTVIASADATAQAPTETAVAVTEVAATTADTTTPSEPAVVVPSDPSALRVSLRPQPRPASMVASSAPVSVQDVSGSVHAPAPNLAEVDPATIPPGTHLAQIGAYETPDLARAQFADLQGTMADLMAGKAMVIEAAQSGGRTFYRLRAHGFATDEDARRFCAALKAEETDCIPVAQK